MPWPWLELIEHQLAQDRDDITPVQSNGANIEHSRDCCVGTKTDEIDDDAEEGRGPYCIKWSACPAVEFGPNVGEGNETITGEGEDGSAEGLHGCEADELDDDESRNCEEDTTTLS